jgi:hypothetical protein
MLQGQLAAPPFPDKPAGSSEEIPLKEVETTPRQHAGQAGLPLTRLSTTAAPRCFS